MPVHRVGGSLLLGGSGNVSAAEVGGREVGFVQCIAVEPHLTGGSVEVLPEAEWQVEGVTEFGQAVEGEFQLVVLKELQRC